MKNILLALCLVMLTACGLNVGTRSIPMPPAASDITEPLRSTNIDERGIKLAFDTYDTVLTAVDQLIAAKVITPGSPRALQLRAALYRVQQALNVAASAQRAGNAESYAAAMADAKAAYVSIQNLLKGAQ